MILNIIEITALHRPRLVTKKNKTYKLTPSQKHIGKAVARRSWDKLYPWPCNKKVCYQSPWPCNAERNETDVFRCYSWKVLKRRIYLPFRGKFYWKKCPHMHQFSVVYWQSVQKTHINSQWSDIILSCSSCRETTKILCGQRNVRCTTCRLFDLML